VGATSDIFMFNDTNNTVNLKTVIKGHRLGSKLLSVFASISSLISTG